MAKITKAEQFLPNNYNGKKKKEKSKQNGDKHAIEMPNCWPNAK